MKTQDQIDADRVLDARAIRSIRVADLVARAALDAHVARAHAALDARADAIDALRVSGEVAARVADLFEARADTCARALAFDLERDLARARTRAAASSRALADDLEREAMELASADFADFLALVRVVRADALALNAFADRVEEFSKFAGDLTTFADRAKVNARKTDET